MVSYFVDEIVWYKIRYINDNIYYIYSYYFNLFYVSIYIYRMVKYNKKIQTWVKYKDFKGDYWDTVMMYILFFNIIIQICHFRTSYLLPFRYFNSYFFRNGF